MADFTEIFARYPDTDKGSIHSYASVYDVLFAPFKGKEISLLEVGVRGGGSLNVWRDYFGLLCCIIGVDNGSELKLRSDKRVKYGDSTKPSTLNEIGFDYGLFDIIIDDGNHDPLVQCATFGALKPYLDDGGVYIIEDVESIETANKIASTFGGKVIDLRHKKNRFDDIIVVWSPLLDGALNYEF